MSKKNELSNFISLCKHVYLLSEHDSIISHDIPFKEAYSGSIDVVLKSENPIYIRNHYVDGDAFYKNKDNVKISTEFCHYEGTPYIPATSIKGMIRSVLEILSYSKLGNKIDEAYLSRIENNSLFEKHLSEKLDLSEAIFGTTDLKGRVIFSHLLAEEYTQEEVISTILMSPVAKEDKIGWKRYPMESDVQPNTKNKKDTIITKFKPLSNATFSGKIVFHNLRDYELGALLSALTFHKTDGAYHLIGMAKSQKYAKIKLAITLKSEKNLDTFLKAYEKKINSEIIFDNDKFWNESRYIKRLIERHSSEDKISTLLSEKEIEIIKNKNKNKNKKQEQKQKINNLINMYERIEAKKIRRIHLLTQLPNTLNIEKDSLDIIINNLDIQMQNNDSVANKDMLRIIDKILRDDYNIVLIKALLVEKNATLEQLLLFAENESIDIKENSKYLSLDIAESIIKYMDVE